MSIINHVHLFSRLRIKGSDFPVAPPRNNGLAVSHETHGIALTVGVVDSEELGTILGVPNTDII